MYPGTYLLAKVAMEDRMRQAEAGRLVHEARMARRASQEVRSGRPGGRLGVWAALARALGRRRQGGVGAPVGSPVACGT